jgi:hypothetical protein
MKRLFLTIIVCVLLSGCVGHQAIWSMVGGKQVLDTDHIEVEWPAAWMQFLPAESDEKAKKEGTILLITRDGIALQTIGLKKNALDKGFPHTQKKASQDMRVQELADMMLDDVRADPSIMDVQLLENSPAQLGGVPGFKLVIGYRNKEGLLKQGMIYGCVNRGNIYSLTYNATRRHYFALDLPTFESVKSSFTWKEGAGT